MKIIIAGDYSPANRARKMVEEGDYSFFDQVRPILADADLSIVNFETVIPAPGSKPLKKNGPNLHAPTRSVEALVYAGFDVATLANNHILDHGTDSLLMTKKSLEDAGIKTVGGGANLAEAEETLYLTVKDKTLAVINCSENEFSVATPTDGGGNPLNPIRQYKAIKDARKKADYVLVIVHGGHEGYNLPSTRMQELYRFFVDAGADAVVNHHQHVYSGYEVYNGKPIFYGLGNFCFDSPYMDHRVWCPGYMVEIEFDSEKPKFNLMPYIQFDKGAMIEMGEFEGFDEKIKYLNAIIADPRKLKDAQTKYYTEKSDFEINRLQPYPNRIMTLLRNRWNFPRMLSDKVLLILANAINCESHLDRLRFALQRKFETLNERK